MKLFFMRHGKAEEKKPGIRDEDRKLTSEGRRDVEAIARLIPDRPEVIYTSPLLRARETAEIVASIHGTRIIVVEELSPSKASLKALKNLEVIDKTLFIGHAPSIEEIISELIGGGKVKLKAGGLAVVEAESLEKGKGVLTLLLTPSIALSILG